MKVEFATIDEYLNSVSAEKRTALTKLRRDIRAAAPSAVECISYGIPAFRLNGRMLVAFGAAAKHCSFFPGTHPVRIHLAELKAYSARKGTVRFSPEQALPSTLVRKLVKTRVAQHAAEKKKSAAKPRPREKSSKKKKA